MLALGLGAASYRVLAVEDENLAAPVESEKQPVPRKKEGAGNATSDKSPSKRIQRQKREALRTAARISIMAHGVGYGTETLHPRRME